MKRQIAVLIAVILSIAAIWSLSSCGSGSGCGRKKNNVPPISTTGTQTDESTPEISTSDYEADESGTPVESTPVESVHLESTPVESTPIESTPVESTPVESTPIESTPVESTPVESTPIESTPIESTPVESTPIESTPVESTPIESTPVESTPIESTPEEPVIEYEPCDETVYVFGTTVGLNLRSTDDFDDESNIVMVVENATEMRRIGYNELYSKVEYEGVTYFCSSAHITTDLPASMIVFSEVHEIVYVYPDGEWTGFATLYVAPDRSQHANKVIAAKTALYRTGIYYDDSELNGWSRVVLVDLTDNTTETFYMRNSVLTVTAPEQ